MQLWLESRYESGDSIANKYHLCNKGISIYEYLPTSAQIYYDPLLWDLNYPFAADPEYWGKILVYYLKKYKLRFVASIWPVEVELPLLMVDKENIIRSEDIKYVVWGGITIVMIGLISLFEKIRNARTMQEIVAEG